MLPLKMLHPPGAYVRTPLDVEYSTEFVTPRNNRCERKIPAGDQLEIVGQLEIMLKKTLEGLILLVFTTAFMFGLAEMATRIFLSSSAPEQGSLTEQLERSKSLPVTQIGETESLRGLIESNKEPDIVYQLRPRIEGKFLGKPLVTNSFGIRDREYSFDKPDSTIRIVGLGDSVMFGWGVNEDESYLSLLEQELNRTNTLGKKVEVLNFAVPGYNTTMEVATLEKRAIQFKPDLVIVHFINNDWSVPYFMERPTDYWSFKKCFFCEFVSERVALLDGKSTTKNLVLAERGGRSREESAEVLEQYKFMVGPDGFIGALDRLAAATKPLGIPVLIIAGSGSKEQKALLQKIAVEKHGFQLVRVGPIVEQYFASLGRPVTKSERKKLITLSARDPHPNALGHKLYGDAIIPAVTQLLGHVQENKDRN